MSTDIKKYTAQDLIDAGFSTVWATKSRSGTCLLWSSLPRPSYDGYVLSDIDSNVRFPNKSFVLPRDLLDFDLPWGWLNVMSMREIDLRYYVPAQNSNDSIKRNNTMEFTPKQIVFGPRNKSKVTIEELEARAKNGEDVVIMCKSEDEMEVIYYNHCKEYWKDSVANPISHSIFKNLKDSIASFNRLECHFALYPTGETVTTESEPENTIHWDDVPDNDLVAYEYTGPDDTVNKIGWKHGNHLYTRKLSNGYRGLGFSLDDSYSNMNDGGMRKFYHLGKFPTPS